MKRMVASIRTRRSVWLASLVLIVCQQLLHVLLPRGDRSTPCLVGTIPSIPRLRATKALGRGPIRATQNSVEPGDVPKQAVSLGMQVQVDFTLACTDTGEILDTTEGSQPLSFVCGQKQAFPGLDMAVQSMAVGETRKLPLTGEEGFGDYDAAKVSDIPVKYLPEGAQVGAKLQLQGAQGLHQARIIEMNDTLAILDFNHPLAGLPLTLTVTIISCEKSPVTSSQWQGQAVKPRIERIEKLKSLTSGVICAVCCEPATLCCSKCNHVLYCSKECLQRHWECLGHSETCHLANHDFQLNKSEPSASIGAVEMSTLRPELFQEYSSQEGQPVIVRGILGRGACESDWDLDSVVESFGSGTKFDIRFYRGVATTPHKWTDVGYCDSTRTTVEGFAKMIRSGLAQEHDAYVNSDLVGTAAESSRLGQILRDSLAKIREHTGLRPTTTLGDQLNIWWGAPGHTEPLHCDANDGTLLQLRGRKKVILFPASDWLNLYPFPTSAKMSWAWSRISLQDVDVQSYPDFRKSLPRRREVILEEGDALFIPACWAHQVTGLGDGSRSDSQHVLSVNRFWKTSIDRTTRWLPAAVGDIFRQSFPNGM